MDGAMQLYGGALKFAEDCLRKAPSCGTAALMFPLLNTYARGLHLHWALCMPHVPQVSLFSKQSTANPRLGIGSTHNGIHTDSPKAADLWTEDLSSQKSSWNSICPLFPYVWSQFPYAQALKRAQLAYSCRWGAGKLCSLLFIASWWAAPTFPGILNYPHLDRAQLCSELCCSTQRNRSLAFLFAYL